MREVMELIEVLIGKRIKEQRKKNKLTQEQLSEKLGISKKTYEKIYDEICETAGICILDKFGMIIMFGDPSEYIISCETDFKNRTEKYCKNYLPS